MTIKEFKKQCGQIREICQPDKTWVKESRSFLMSKVEQNLEFKEQKISIWLKLADVFVPANFRLQPVVAFSLVIGLFLVTSFASVNASKNTLPGHPLYQIKITAEQIKYGLSFSEISRTKTAMSIVENRVGELKMIAQNENPEFSGGEKERKVAVAVYNVKSSLNKVKDKLNSINQEEKEKQEVIAMVKEIDEKLTVVKNEIKETNQADEELAQVAEEVSIVALAVLNQGVVAGDQDKQDQNEITGVITPEAATDFLEDKEEVNLPIKEPVLVIEEIEQESEEFGVGIGE